LTLQLDLPENGSTMLAGLPQVSHFSPSLAHIVAIFLPFGDRLKYLSRIDVMHDFADTAIALSTRDNRATDA
jgi:hypothetical protein